MESKEYEELEKQEKAMTAHNNEILDEFQVWLSAKSLKPKTINNHVQNMAFFANNYLLRYEIQPIEKGYEEIGSYLGDYFIRKASWASKYTIAENIAGFKKFYTFLYEKGGISKQDLNWMKEIIKEEKEYWMEKAENF